MVSALTVALRDRGLEVAVYAARGLRVGDDPTGISGIETHVFPTSPLSRLWTAHATGINKALRAEVKDFDLVHIHELWHYPHFAAARAAYRWGIPYVISPHGNLDPWALSRKRLKKALYLRLVQRSTMERAAGFHAIASKELSQLRALGLQNDTAVVPNGVAPMGEHDLDARSVFEARHPQLAGQLVILFMGRIHRKKGLDVLARAFSALISEREDVWLVVGGPDEDGYRAEVERLLDSGGALSRTIFTGMLTGQDKQAAFARGDVFVLPSYSEGFSIVLLEAMQCGLPVVATPHCNFPEVQEHGAGLLVEPAERDLKSALAYLLDRPAERRAMGQRGRELVQDRYSWGSVADRMVEFYQRVLAHGTSFTSKEAVADRR